MRDPRYLRDVLAPDRYFRSLARPEAPAFIFHDVRPERLRRQLRFLAEAGYETLTCAEASDLQGDPGRRVVLTFDDGRRSLWSVAVPLLREFGFRATAFVSPGLMREADTAEERGEDPLVGWPEAREMRRGGTVELQVHGFAHSRVFTGPRVVDFEHPGRRDPDRGVSGWLVRRGGEDVIVPVLRPGEPIYESGSRWSASRRFLPNENVADACAGLVQERGPDEFFARPDWRRELSRLVSGLVASGGATAKDPVRFETSGERRRSLESLLRSSLAVLEERTGVRSTHFALPWAEGAEDVEEIAASCGIRHIHWGHLPARDLANRPPAPVRHHPRLKEIFLLRLPGPGRLSVPGLVGDEWRRRRIEAAAEGPPPQARRR